MPLRSSRIMGLTVLLTYVLLTACASVGSQPPVYEEPKAKADPCAQTPVSKDCKKT